MKNSIDKKIASFILQIVCLIVAMCGYFFHIDLFYFIGFIGFLFFSTYEYILYKGLKNFWRVICISMNVIGIFALTYSHISYEPYNEAKTELREIKEKLGKDEEILDNLGQYITVNDKVNKYYFRYKLGMVVFCASMIMTNLLRNAVKKDEDEED